MPAQPKHIRAFELRLEANWSSEDVVQMLTPDFVTTVLLPGFPALEPTIKMRALIAFLGVPTQQLISIRDHLPVLLLEADDDKDEWVQVVSGLVRHKLLYQKGAKELIEDSDGLDDHAALSAAVLKKTVTEVLTRAKRIIADRSRDAGDTASGAGGGYRDRVFGEALYFGPLEERYASRKQQQPKEAFENFHFDARDDFLKEFAEDLDTSLHVNSMNNPSSSSVSPTNAATTAATTGFKTTAGGLMKPPSHPAPSGPNLAQARRVNLAATDPSAGSDGRRRTSKPIALAQGRAGLQAGTGGSGHHLHVGGHKTSGGGGVGGTRGARGNAGGGRKMGLMMINVDELQAIEAEKESAREKAKGKPGRKKAKIATDEEPLVAGAAPPAEPDSSAVAGQQGPPASAGVSGNTNGRNAAGAPGGSAGGTLTGSVEETSKKATTPPEGPTIPGAGEIDAVAAMMGLGVTGGGDEESSATETSYLPPALTDVLTNANSLSPEGMQKLQNYFQKKMPEGSPQERVKYHEEITGGDGGEQMRVTSYIRLDYKTWMWDRVHKKKRVK